MVQGEPIDFANVKRTILVVEDNEINREMLCALLEDDFNVLQAENGLVGLRQLEESYEDVSLVLLDVYMPECDGFEFLRRKREDGRYDAVPVIVTTASDSLDDEIKCLELGANDFVVKPYNVEIMMNRINNTIHLRESASIVNQLTWDSVTDLYSTEFFYRHAEEMLRAFPDADFDMVCCDVDNFKSLSDRYGKKACDQLLCDLAERLTNRLPGFIAGGRISSDTFAFLIEHQQLDWTDALDSVTDGLFAANVSVKYGIVAKVNHRLAVSLTCNRAVIALERIKGAVGNGVAWYDDELRKQQLRQQLIVESMDVALRERQFEVHYQPKHGLAEDATCGAEALARWVHPDLGFISPGEFVPLFESNGLVARLDFFICEEACREIRRCRDMGLPLVPISVNASRLDFDIPDLAERISEIADRYEVEHALLHIELTETIYSDDPATVTRGLNELRSRGFGIELDDFGSGYSSLSSLNVLPIDVMKLDMSMIRQASELGDFRIVESTIRLAQSLGLKTVVEGVETSEEVRRLDEIGCDLIQGYYFSKPLRQEEFERYLAKG
jgi:diguanylate cyclase (GGDEF)-like protein